MFRSDIYNIITKKENPKNELFKINETRIGGKWYAVGPNAKKVREAVAYLHKFYPNLMVDGELQTDFALNNEMLQDIFPFSKLAGKKVNTLIFPNLDSANITYKLLKELNKADNIGPIMMGLKKPAHILQLDASVDEIVNMTAIAVIDAQKKQKREQLSNSLN